MDRKPATGRTFPSRGDIETEPSFAAGAAQPVKGVSLRRATLRPPGLWAAIRATAGALGSTGR